MTWLPAKQPFFCGNGTLKTAGTANNNNHKGKTVLFLQMSFKFKTHLFRAHGISQKMMT